MSIAKAEISMSLDGFIAGPGGDLERLHEWLFASASWRERHDREGGAAGTDDDTIARAFSETGAFVMGRGMFDAGERPWGDEPPFRVPVFVITSRPRETLHKTGGTTFEFVTDGVASAVARASRPPA